MKPRLLDLFAGAGGAGVGYARAGFEVHAVDIIEHAKHPDIASFTQDDALDVLAHTDYCRQFDVIHASPPCYYFSTITSAAAKRNHVNLIPITRARLQRIGRPYIIENVAGARRHLNHPFRLCGSSFGLRVERHRFFETNWDVWAPPPCRHRPGHPVGVYGDHPDAEPVLRPDGSERGRKARDLADGQDAMGIDWMGWDDLADAIPPAYSQWIGTQLLDALSPQRVGNPVDN